MQTPPSDELEISVPSWLPILHKSVEKGAKKENAYSSDVVVAMMHLALLNAGLPSRMDGYGLFSNGTRVKTVSALVLECGTVVDYKGRIGWGNITEGHWEEHRKSCNHNPMLPPIHGGSGANNHEWKALPGKKNERQTGEPPGRPQSAFHIVPLR